MEDLLRLAEDAAFFMDVEKIRVCFPPSAELGDCLLVLDGIDEVPPSETWHAMQEVDIIVNTSPSNNETLCRASSAVSQYASSVSTDNAVHSSRSPAASEFSDVKGFHESEVDESAQASPVIASVCSKRLFTPAEGELSMDSFSPTKAAHTIGSTPSPQHRTNCEKSAVIDESNAPNEDNYGFVESTKESEPVVDLPPNENSDTPVPAIPKFELFQEEHINRISWLSGGMPGTSTSNGKVVYYHVTQCFTVQDNIALRAAMLLSAQLGVRLIALTMVESDLIADVKSAVPPTTPQSAPSTLSNQPYVLQTSEQYATTATAGDKRKHGDTMPVSMYPGNPADVHCAVAVSTESCKEPEMARWDQQAVTLKGLRRKSSARMAHILRLKQELAELNIPLLVIEYDPCSPRCEALRPQDSSSREYQQVYNGKSSVTPQPRAPLQSASVQVETIHPIAQILISLCSPGCNSGSSDGNSNVHTMSDSVHNYNTVTPGPETVTNTHEASNTYTPYKTNPLHEYAALPVTIAAQTMPVTSANAAVLVTDDLHHPLQRHVHRAVTAALPSLSLLSVDSCSKLSSLHKNKNDATNIQSFGQFCALCDTQIDSRHEANNQKLTLQELSIYLFQKDTAEFTHVVEKALVLCPYGAIVKDLPHTSKPNGVDTNYKTELSRHEEYGRYLCSVLAKDAELCNNQSVERNNTGNKSESNSESNWSVPWLDILPFRAAHSVQIIDIKLHELRELRARNDNIPHRRQDALFGLCAGTTECVVYNTIMCELYDKGSMISCAKLKYWIVYCMSALYSASQAIQFTYTMLATHSMQDFMCNVSQVSLYVYALREVLTDISENVPVGGSIDRVQVYFDNALSKLVSAF